MAYNHKYKIHHIIFQKIYLQPLLKSYAYLLKLNIISIDISWIANFKITKQKWCHHTNLTIYIVNKIDEYIYQSSYEKSTQAYGFHYHNYLYLSNKNNNDNLVFLYACYYDYINIVKYFLMNKNVNINCITILKF